MEKSEVWVRCLAAAISCRSYATPGNIKEDAIAADRMLEEYLKRFPEVKS